MSETIVMHMDRVEKRDFKEALAKAVYNNFADGENAVAYAVEEELEVWFSTLEHREA